MEQRIIEMELEEGNYLYDTTKTIKDVNDVYTYADVYSHYDTNDDDDHDADKLQTIVDILVVMRQQEDTTYVKRDYFQSKTSTTNTNTNTTRPSTLDHCNNNHNQKETTLSIRDTTTFFLSSFMNRCFTQPSSISISSDMAVPVDNPSNQQQQPQQEQYQYHHYNPYHHQYPSPIRRFIPNVLLVQQKKQQEWLLLSSIVPVVRYPDPTTYSSNERDVVDPGCHEKMVQWCYQVASYCDFQKQETIEIAMSYVIRFMNQYHPTTTNTCLCQPATHHHPPHQPSVHSKQNVQQQQQQQNEANEIEVTKTMDDSTTTTTSNTKSSSCSTISFHLLTKHSLLQERIYYQLVTMTCFYIAIKIHEPTAIAPQFITNLSGGAYTTKDIEKMEQIILTTLHWYMNPPTSLSYVRILLHDLVPIVLQQQQLSSLSQTKKKHQEDDEEQEDLLYDICKEQIEYANAHYDCCMIKPSILAYTSLLNAILYYQQYYNQYNHKETSTTTTTTTPTISKHSKRIIPDLIMNNYDSIIVVWAQVLKEEDILNNTLYVQDVQEYLYQMVIQPKLEQKIKEEQELLLQQKQQQQSYSTRKVTTTMTAAKEQVEMRNASNSSSHSSSSSSTLTTIAAAAAAAPTTTTKRSKVVHPKIVKKRTIQKATTTTSHDPTSLSEKNYHEFLQGQQQQQIQQSLPNPYQQYISIQSNDMNTMTKISLYDSLNNNNNTNHNNNYTSTIDDTIGKDLDDYSSRNYYHNKKRISMIPKSSVSKTTTTSIQKGGDSNSAYEKYCLDTTSTHTTMMKNTSFYEQTSSFTKDNNNNNNHNRKQIDQHQHQKQIEQNVFFAPTNTYHNSCNTH